MIQLKNLKTQEQAKPKSSGRQETIKIIAEVNEIETKKTIQRVPRLHSLHKSLHWTVTPDSPRMTSGAERAPRRDHTGTEKPEADGQHVSSGVLLGN